MHLKLASKYTIFSCCALLFSMFFFAIFHVDQFNKSFLNEAIYDADSLSEMLLRTTYHQMLEDDRQQLQKVIDEAGSMERIQRIRVLGREGLVNFSTDHAEIGASLNNNDGSCSFCHFHEDKVLLNASAKDRSRVFIGPSGEEVLGMTKGIYNEESCYTAECHFHSPDEKKLGVLDVVISLDKMSTMALSHYSPFFVSAFLMLLSLSGFHYIFTQIYVSRPLNTLLRHTHQLAHGNLNARIKKWPSDEFGELSQSFNVMAQNLGKAQHELQDWGNTLELKVSERTAEINAMQAQLVQSAKLASLGELVAGIAHEINNPLSGILIFSSLATKAPDLSSEVKSNLDVVISETKRCAKIVHGLLEFSRESIPEKRIDSINRILKQSLHLITQQSLFQNIAIKYELDEELPDISVDSDQIQQVFFNLIVNAGQAMEKGGVLTLVSELDRKKGMIIIKIIDNGVGINEEHLSRIFDPFFSTKPEMGSGLGLSISYGIVENHAGQIEVQSITGKGTQFTISLPLDKDTIKP